MTQNTAFVILGGTGNIAHRKIIPALFLLYKRKIIGHAQHQDFRIFALARSKKTSEIYREEIFADAKANSFLSDEDIRIWSIFEKRISYIQFDFQEKEEYDNLKKIIGAQQKIIYHQAVPYIDIISFLENLRDSGMDTKDSSMVMETPFGQGLGTARLLEKELRKTFAKESVFRIDHYLGKESVQNIIAIKFANIFEHLFRKEFVDHIQIIADETAGIGKRGGYYDRTGAIKDMVQGHLLQLISLIAMDAPKSLSAKNFHSEKEKVLADLRPFTKTDALKNIVLGQYDGYRKEERVANGSNTETFAAMKLFINSKRWHGVPFYIRTGKRLPKKTTKIIIFFKEKGKLFRGTDRNYISIDIYPEEGVSIKINMKKEEKFETTSKDLLAESRTAGRAIDDVKDNAGKFPVQRAYMRLFIDVLNGEQILFASAKEIQLMWRFIETIEGHIDKDRLQFPNYAQGANGPKDADGLIARDGRKWMD